jgi:hypothetical protein
MTVGSFVLGQFNLVRFLIQRPKTSNALQEPLNETLTGAAHKLISLHAKATPDYTNNSPLTVPGHLGNAPFNLFVACVSIARVCGLFIMLTGR